MCGVPKMQTKLSSEDNTIGTGSSVRIGRFRSPTGEDMVLRDKVLVERVLCEAASLGRGDWRRGGNYAGRGGGKLLRPSPIQRKGGETECERAWQSSLCWRSADAH
jgi:hypothetical protein